MRYTQRNIPLAFIPLLTSCNPDSTDPPQGNTSPIECRAHEDCLDDGIFCNGHEYCNNHTGACFSLGNPCQPGEICNEDADRCDNCAIDENCDDHDRCTTDTCVDGQCTYTHMTCDIDFQCVDGHCTSLCAMVDCDDGNPCTLDYCSGGICFSNDVPCSFGQVCVASAGGCVPAPGDPCFLQCNPGLGCPIKPLDQYDDYETTRSQWLNEEGMSSETCKNSWYRAAGVCADGTKFLNDNLGLTSETHFFDAATGQFIALRTSTDVIDYFCCGLSYWPLDVKCEDAVVTEIICGTEVEIGATPFYPSDEYCDNTGDDPCLISFYVPLNWQQPTPADFEDYQTKKARWLESPGYCNYGARRVAGTCQDGTFFLYQSNYEGIVVDYFDPTLFRFLSRSFQSYESDVTCCGESYYPGAYSCEKPTVNEVICGHDIQLGDVLPALGVSPCEQEEPLSDPCVIHCASPVGHPCTGYPSVGFEDYPTAHDLWIEVFANGCLVYAVAGICANGARFLADSDFIAHVRYYDSTTQELIAFTTYNDVYEPVCGGRTYWPELYDCEEATITEIICTDGSPGPPMVGDVFPWLANPP